MYAIAEAYINNVNYSLSTATAFYFLKFIEIEVISKNKFKDLLLSTQMLWACETSKRIQSNCEFTKSQLTSLSRNVSMYVDRMFW